MHDGTDRTAANMHVFLLQTQHDVNEMRAVILNMPTADTHIHTVDIWLRWQSGRSVTRSPVPPAAVPAATISVGVRKSTI